MRAAAVVAITTLCATGCARSGTPEAVSSTELQNGLAEQVTKTGASAKWIDCPKPLAARVGATARCDVTFSPSDAVTALLTTIEVVDGSRQRGEERHLRLRCGRPAGQLGGLPIHRKRRHRERKR